MEYCEETVSIMMENFINKGNITAEDISREIQEVKGAISNERLWQKGAPDKRTALMHEQNIVNLSEYLARLTVEAAA